MIRPCQQIVLSRATKVSAASLALAGIICLAMAADTPHDATPAPLAPKVVACFDAPRKDRPAGWIEYAFDPGKTPRKSVYDVIKLGRKHVLRASTDRGASMICKKVDIDPAKYPYLVWRWRVDQRFPKGDGRVKSGDDYPIKIGIAFRYEPSRVSWTTRVTYALAAKKGKGGLDPPLYVFYYCWANRVAKNTWVSNPFQNRVKMIAMRSRKDPVKVWRTEATNYVRDFKDITKSDPTQVQAVFIMIDGDTTNSRGVSYIESIEFRAKPPTDLPVSRLKGPKKSRKSQ